MGEFGGTRVLHERTACSFGSLLERSCERLRVQLHAIRAGERGPADRFGFGIDKKADADAQPVQALDNRWNAIGRRAGLPARLTGNLTRHNRHECALRRSHFLDEVEEIRARIAFDVVFDRPPGVPHHARDGAYVLGSDVAAIGPRMHRDPRRACGNAYVGRVDNARNSPAARITQRRDFVDIDA